MATSKRAKDAGIPRIHRTVPGATGRIARSEALCVSCCARQERLSLRLIKAAVLLTIGWIANATAIAQGDDRLVGVWDSTDAVRTYQLLFRTNGRYQLDTQSTDPGLDLSSTERGHYQVDGQGLTLTPYDYVAKPDPRQYQFQRSGDSLSLTSTDYGQTQFFQFRPGSKADVLARENVHPGLVGVWRRHIAFYGEVEGTFRPGGYYVIKTTPDDPQFATGYVAGAIRAGWEPGHIQSLQRESGSG